MMITLIGVGHVFDIEDQLNKQIRYRRPSVVAVELDRARYEALMSGEHGGKAPLFYRILSLVQKRIAKKFGVQVGGEMIAAVKTAEEIGANVALIDMPAQIVFKKLLNSMSFKERVFFALSVVAGLFVTKKRVEKELERFQSEDQDYMGGLRVSMPSISKILIRDRNIHMARNLKKLEEKFGTVLAVVGDGHIQGIEHEIRGREYDVVRLKELRDGTAKLDDTSTTYSFSYEIQ
ncbi:MAG: TraB domain-containing protein [Thermoplasmata archaeon]